MVHELELPIKHMLDELKVCRIQIVEQPVVIALYLCCQVLQVSFWLIKRQLDQEAILPLHGDCQTVSILDDTLLGGILDQVLLD